MSIVDIKETKTSLEKVKPDKNHEYRVKAVNEFGASEPTDSATVVKHAGPPLLPVTKPVVSDLKPKSVNIKWQKAENQPGFKDSPITYKVQCR